MALNESSTESRKYEEKKSAPSRVVLSWAFTQTPFLRPPNSSPNCKSSNFVRPSIILRDLRSSAVSAADHLFRFLHLFASENPVLKKVLSWSSEFRGLRQQASLSLSLATCLYMFLAQCPISNESIAFCSDIIYPRVFFFALK